MLKVDVKISLPCNNGCQYQSRCLVLQNHGVGLLSNLFNWSIICNKERRNPACTFHPLGMVNPSYSMSVIAFLNEPKIGGNSRMLSRATCQVFFIFFISSNVRFSPGILLLIISTCSGKK